MAGDREVQDPTAIMAKDYEHKQQPKCGRWNHDEIGGDEIPEVIRHERMPSLGRRVPLPQHVLGYGRSEILLPSFPNSPRCAAPELSSPSTTTPSGITRVKTTSCCSRLTMTRAFSAIEPSPVENASEVC